MSRSFPEANGIYGKKGYIGSWRMYAVLQSVL